MRVIVFGCASIEPSVIKASIGSMSHEEVKNYSNSRDDGGFVPVTKARHRLICSYCAMPVGT
jgi:hypothetical protein